MSCDWDVHCVDCGEDMGMSDANHRRDLVLDLVAKADAVAELATVDVEIRHYHYSYVDASWFLRHRGHRLRGRSEYAQWADECNEREPHPGSWSATRRVCYLSYKHDGEHMWELERPRD